MDRKEIGRRIRLARKKAGLTQEDLANEVGVSQSYIVKIELGTAENPGSQVMNDIIKAVGSSHGWIYYEREDMDALDDDSIDIAILYSHLSSDKKQAIKTLIKTISQSENKSEEENH